MAHVDTQTSHRTITAAPAIEGLPPCTLAEGSLRLRFARTAADVDAVMRLRFDVFNCELHEGLTESFATGRDEDDFDAGCHHLMVMDDRSGRLVGTYRLQTSEMAARHRGFYSASEFDLAALPANVRAGAVELGRACVAKDFRNRRALYLLWQGLAAYMTWNRKRFLFGCCSLPGTDIAAARAAREYLVLQGAIHPHLHAAPLAAFAAPKSIAPAGDPELPSLFRAYLRMGAKVLGGPAIDHAFGTTDFFVLLDLTDLSPNTVGMFFGR
ncbi:MAG: GNAT family N-acyltransferase [Acidobacteriota bacterium]